MKICLVLKKINKGGGIPRVVTYLANVLSEKHNVTILSFEGGGETRKLIYNLDTKVECTFLFDQVNNYKKSFLKINRAVEKYFNNNTYDTVIISGMDYIPFFVLYLLKFPKSKFIAWEHSNYSIGKVFGLKWIGRKIALKRFDKIVVLTKQDKKLYEKNESNIRKLEQIYNPDFLENCDWSYNSESKKIISCGALTYQKGFDIALDAAKIVFEKISDWKWEIWGDGEDYNFLNNKIKELGIEKNVELKGFSNNIINQYKDYAFFALTSRYEGFCMVILEAMKCGLPIVSFDINCGPSEIIKGNGFLVPAYDIEKMAESIIKLINDKDARCEYSEQSRKIIKDFGKENFIVAWERIIEDIN